MKCVRIGAFEAKTRFSELPRGVERGVGYEILRRGRPVARLIGGVGAGQAERIDALLSQVRSYRGKARVSVAEILDWKRTGRQ